jgi:D-amino-acid dehydrogenase
MDIEGAVYFPKDCHLQPERLIEAFENRIRRNGGTFVWDAEVTGWRTEGNRLVAAKTAAHGEIDGDEFIICGGSWSPGLLEELQLRLPMQAGKGYSLTLAAPRQLPQTCSILCEARVACTPMGKSLRFGGTMEIAGMDEKSINPRRVHGITRAIPAYFPAFQETDFEGVRPWCGLRPCSPDGLPYLGRTAAAENLIIASGHAMLGVSLGPVTGLLAAGDSRR